MEIDQGLLHRMQRLLVGYSLYRDDVLTLHRCSGVMHALTAKVLPSASSTITVHAPQSPDPQPCFVPLKFSVSRKKSSREILWSGTSATTFDPFTLNLVEFILRRYPISATLAAKISQRAYG